MATVYRLRHLGHELPRGKVLELRRRGHFAVTTRNDRPGWPRYLTASLAQVEGGDFVIPVLVGVKLVRVERGGLELEGDEVVPRGRHHFKGSSDRYPQAWWVALQGKLAHANGG
jgi:hypothetical protein